MEDYREELKLQIDRISVGKAVEAKLQERWTACNTALANVVGDVEVLQTETLAGKAVEEEGDFLKNATKCERAHKIRQAIKICSTTGEVYWMWRLQPGEKVPDRHEYV